MAAQNRFYRPISEQDTQAGYVDIFLCPLLEIYSDMKHSYIVELKYAKYKDSESRVEELRQEAITQANYNRPTRIEPAFLPKHQSGWHGNLSTTCGCLPNTQHPDKSL